MLRLLILLLSTNCTWLGGEYVAPDQAFRLHVPPGYFVRIGTEKPSFSYIPVCHQASAVCLEYPRERFAGTNFGAASVEVTRVSVTSDKACIDAGKSVIYGDALEGSRPIPLRPTRTIDGITFRHTIDGGVAAGHNIGLDKYRGFDKGKCFEISTAVTQSNFASYAPGMIREFTKRDRANVTRELNKIVRSFKASDRP